MRIVWMPKMLKEEIGERFSQRAVELGYPDLLNQIADETIGTSEDAILPFLTEKVHPALSMPSII